jgi:hypothetical protein
MKTVGIYTSSKEATGNSHYAGRVRRCHIFLFKRLPGRLLVVVERRLMAQ